MASSAVLMKPISPLLSSSTHFSPIFSTPSIPSSLSFSLQSLLSNPIRFVPETPQKVKMTPIQQTKVEERSQESHSKKRRLSQSSSSDESLPKKPKGILKSTGTWTEESNVKKKKSKEGKKRRDSKPPVDEDKHLEKAKKKAEKASVGSSDTVSFEDFMRLQFEGPKISKKELKTVAEANDKNDPSSIETTAQFSNKKADMSVDFPTSASKEAITSPQKLKHASDHSGSEDMGDRTLAKKKRKHSVSDSTENGISNAAEAIAKKSKLTSPDAPSKPLKEKKEKKKTVEESAPSSPKKASIEPPKEKSASAPADKSRKEAATEPSTKEPLPKKGKKAKSLSDGPLLDVNVRDIPEVFRFAKDLPAHFDIKRAWKKLPTNILPQGKQATSGSHNPSNFCYMNSALQTLAHCPQAVFFLVYYHLPSQCNVKPGVVKQSELKAQGGFKPCMACALRKFVMRSYDGSRRTAKEDYKLLETVGQILGREFARPARSHRQSDAGEALSLILQRANDQLRLYTKCKVTAFERIFNWRIGHTIKCSKCSHLSVTQQSSTLRVVTVPFEKAERVINLSKISNKFSQDTVEGYKCEGCNKVVRAVKTERVFKLPHFALINLSREMQASKRGVTESRRPVSCATTETLNDSTGGKGSFDLTSAAVHMGSHHGGHWVHFGRQPSEKWVCHSDDSVREERVNGELSFGKRQMISLIGLSRQSEERVNK